MKAVDICHPCLCRLALQASRLATADGGLRVEAAGAALKAVDDNFSTDGLTLDIATKIHHAVKETTGNPDPYRRMKDEEIKLSKGIIAELAPSYPQDIKGLLALSVLGNSIDFFRRQDDVVKDLRAPLKFTVDHSDRFIEKLKQAKNILFLGDNAGEAFFDLPLIRCLEQYAPVTYVVKGAPVQNDATLYDLKVAGVDGQLNRVITTGLATPGVILPRASAEFRRAFEKADVVLAKGMGYWEGLSELPPDGRVLYCSMAKCQPVADSLGVPLNSYVMLLR